jgi:hypothetical protein
MRSGDAIQNPPGSRAEPPPIWFAMPPNLECRRPRARIAAGAGFEPPPGKFDGLLA